MEKVTSSPAPLASRIQRPTGVTKPVLARLRLTSGSGGCGHVGDGFLRLDLREHVARRQSGEEERIDVGHADLDRMGHAGPVGIAQQLVAHVERGLERGDAIEVAERASGLQLVGDVAERRQATQPLLHHSRIEQIVEFPRHVDAAPEQIGAGPVAAILQHAGRLRMQARARRDGRRHQPAHQPAEAGDEAERPQQCTLRGTSLNDG